MPDTRQVATRVSTTAAEALDAAAYLKRQSMQQLLAPVVEAYAKEVARDPHVKAAIAIRAAADAVKTPNVRSIDQKRRKS